MPKETFFRLKPEKQDSIVRALVQEFEAKNLYHATVKDIVEQLNIPRGSFYQYFESLEEAYFYILDLKFHDIHMRFMELYRGDAKNLESALLEYGQFLAKEIYRPTNYKLFRNRYLSWSPELEIHWRDYQLKNQVDSGIKEVYANKRLELVGSLVHMIIQKLFINDWDQDTFAAEYVDLVKFIMEGINYV